MKNQDVMDDASAWVELCRFADEAGLEMDERAEPGMDELGDDEDDESEVSDYGLLFRSLRRGNMVVSDDGVLTVTWKRAPREGRGKLTLNPREWPYGKALRAAAGGAVSKAAKGRSGGDDNVGKVHRFLETLGGEAPSEPEAWGW